MPNNENEWSREMNADLITAWEYHQAGRSADAACGYDSLLAQQPDHFRSIRWADDLDSLARRVGDYRRLTAHWLSGQQGQRRHRDGRGVGRGDHPRAVDAPLAAVVRRAALGLRVGRGRSDTSTRTAGSTSLSPRCRASPAASTSRETLRSSGYRRCARAPASAASRSPSGSPQKSGRAASAWSTCSRGK